MGWQAAKRRIPPRHRAQRRSGGMSRMRAAEPRDLLPVVGEPDPLRRRRALGDRQARAATPSPAGSAAARTRRRSSGRHSPDAARRSRRRRCTRSCRSAPRSQSGGRSLSHHSQFGRSSRAMADFSCLPAAAGVASAGDWRARSQSASAAPSARATRSRSAVSGSMPAASLCAIRSDPSARASWPKAAGYRSTSGAMMVSPSPAASAASAARSRPANICDRAPRLLARSGRKASGRAAASCRQMSTASWLAASASSRRPRLERRDAEIVQAHGEVGEEGVGPRRRRAARCRCSTASWLAASASSRRPRSERSAAEIVQAAGEVGEEGVGPRRRQLPADVDRLLARRQRLLPPPQVGEAAAEIVQARWRGRGGRRRAAPPRAAGRCSTASWLAASASSRRPRSERRLPRLFRLLARSGRKASGRAAASCRRMLHRLLARRQRLLPPPQVGEAVAEIVQAPGEVGEEGVGPRRRELPVDVHRLLARRQRLLPPPQVGEAVAEIVQAHGEVGEEGVGPRRRELPVDVDRLLARRQRLLPPTQVGEADAERADTGGKMAERAPRAARPLHRAPHRSRRPERAPSRRAARRPEATGPSATGTGAADGRRWRRGRPRPARRSVGPSSCARLPGVSIITPTSSAAKVPHARR